MSRKARQMRASGNKGYSLIEIIVAIIIMGVICVIAGLFVIQQLSAGARMNEYASALNLARREVEVVNGLAFRSQASFDSNVVTLNTSNYLNTGYDVYRTVSYAAGGDLTTERLKQVLVQVRKSGSAENLATLITYVARNITSGL